MRPLEFGWYLPTHGDTTAYGLMEAQIAGSPELCDRVVQAAEKAGFEYLLIPVGSTCWEAWISGAFMAARSSTIKPLIARTKAKSKARACAIPRRSAIP